MSLLYIEMIGILLLGITLLLLGSRNPKANELSKKSFQYRKKNFLITKSEHEFFDLLVNTLGDKYYIFPQIHLPSFLDHKVVGQNWNNAYRHIDEKSVDFVICDKNYLRPLLAIELDDSSHSLEERLERDTEVERILKLAEVPLIRFENHGSFNKDEICTSILATISK